MAQLFGTAANDALKGGRDDDYVNGGGGDDLLTGGKGHDGFGMSLGGGHDVVTDFEFNRRNDFDHDNVVFDGWGNFVDAIWSGRLAPIALEAGDTFATNTGHVLTVGAAADGDLVLTWETGESVELNGVSPGEFHADWMTSLDSYGWAF